MKITLRNFVAFLLYSCFMVGNSSAQVIFTCAGNGTIGYSGDGGPATAAKIQEACRLATNAAGDLFISGADFRIRKVNGSGIITTIAGDGTASPIGIGYGDGGPATAARLESTISYISTDATGSLYLPASDNVRKIDASGIISTIAGVRPYLGFSGDGGPATNARLYNVSGVGIDHFGNLFLSDIGNYRLRKIDLAGYISTFAGNGVSGYSGDGGTATNASLQTSSNVLVDASNNIYIASYAQNVIRKITPSGIINTYAGNGTTGFSGDGGPATAASFNYINGMAIDTGGNIFVCDGFNRRIRKISASGIVTTIAGNGTLGFSGDGGPATSCQFNQPKSIAVSYTPCGEEIAVSDFGNSRIRKIVYQNHAPVFTSGHTHNLAVCQDTGSINISSLLTISDIDAGQSETWDTLKMPTHGTLFASYFATSTGGAVTPVGMVYTPTAGYSGHDTFKIIVYDCGHEADTITFFVTINPKPFAGIITGPDTVCKGKTITLNDTTTGGIWTTTNAHAVVIAGIVSGITPGQDTIRYIVINSCGRDTANHIITVKNCVNSVETMPEAGNLIVLPNPGDGRFVVAFPQPLTKTPEIFISDAAGKMIPFQTALVSGKLEIRASAAPGIYLLTIGTEGGRYYRRIVIE